MECFKYAFNILVVSHGMYSINLGGLQADLKGVSGAGGSPLRKNKYYLFEPSSIGAKVGATSL